MKAVILAAGEGTRLKKYTKDLPKGMLEFGGMPVIKRQIDLFRAAGMDRIVIVKGFAQEKIDYPGIAYYINRDFSSTNMVASLFCAREELEGELIVSYADILFERELLDRLVASPHDIVVTVDTAWRSYWLMRYGTTGFDTESLKMDDGLITSLGRENPPQGDIDGRYVGLLKFSAVGVESLKKTWQRFREEYWDRPWQVSGKPLRNAYMTDMVQALIDGGNTVHALKTEGGWIEFDTNEDYEKAVAWHRDGSLGRLIRL